jgi:hypothetical protein
MISELHSASHKLGKISNMGQDQCHNFGIKRQNEWLVVCFAVVADSNPAVEVVGVDSNPVVEVVAVDSKPVAVVAVVAAEIVAVEEVGAAQLVGVAQLLVE